MSLLVFTVSSVTINDDIKEPIHENLSFSGGYIVQKKTSNDTYGVWKTLEEKRRSKAERKLIGEKQHRGV